MADCNLKRKGRPSKINNYEKKKNIIALMYQRGFTDDEVAKAMDVSRKTLDNWKTKYKDFLHTLKKSKEISDHKVEQALFERATGYEHEDVDIRVVYNQIVKTKIIKHYPPDPTSMIFWLKNRQPDKWREKTETKVGFDEKAVELILAALPPEIAETVRKKLFQIKEN